MKRSMFVAGSLVLALSACGERDQSVVSSLADQEHSVEAYFADNELRSATIEACRASNEAESKILQAKPACRNALAAMKLHVAQATDKAIEDENAKLEEAFKKARSGRKQGN